MRYDLVFERADVEEAIRLTRENGLDWLYREYPKPNGISRKSTTGFLIFDGETYPVKPLGRLANELAGSPMQDNPNTNVFRQRFTHLNFRLIDSPAGEAKQAAERQRKLAETWARPDQAKFRAAVFARYGAKCIISNCETLEALEAAHVVSVSDGGCDECWNGLPLRADLHRLLDAEVLTLDPATWVVSISGPSSDHYGALQGLNIAARIKAGGCSDQLAAAFKKRASQD